MTQFSNSKVLFFWSTYESVLQLNEFQSYRDFIEMVSNYAQSVNATTTESGADSILNRLASTSISEVQLKKSFEKAFELVNRNSRYGRFTKGELYATMFIGGLPMGFIAKLMLNGNLGPIRNAIILHQNTVYVAATSHTGLFVKSILNSVSLTGTGMDSPTAKGFYFTLINSAYKFGGLSLAEKLAFGNDWTAFVDNYSQSVPSANAERLTNILSVDLYGHRAISVVYFVYARALNRIGNASRRGVRRTGLTTSRNAAAVAAGQQLPSTQSVSQTGSTVSQSAVTPAAQLTNTPTTPQTRVRDIPFTGTLGLEVELVPATDMRESELINALIAEFRKRNLSVQGVGYTHNVTTYWKLVPDGSIRPYGVECVSPILKGKRGLTEVKKAIQAMRAAGGSVNKSVGVHVHFGIQGMTLQQWKNLLLNYAGFEPLINKTLFRTRRNSQWAALISGIRDYKDKIERSNTFEELARNLFGGDARDYRSGGRYHSVNIFAFLRHGTVEFRQLQGSTEDDTIIYWIYWLHFLLEVSKRKTLSFFDYKQVRNITPVWLSTWLGNRSFDMSEENFNAPI